MNEKGQGLLEVLIATALIGMVVVGLMGGVVVGILGTNSVDQGTTATNIARSQMEFVKSQAYDGTGHYDVLPQADLPEGWTTDQITIVVATPPGADPNYLQLITVTVSFDSAPIFTLEGYKTNR